MTVALGVTIVGVNWDITGDLTSVCVPRLYRNNRHRLPGKIGKMRSLGGICGESNGDFADIRNSEDFSAKTPPIQGDIDRSLASSRLSAVRLGFRKDFSGKTAPIQGRIGRSLVSPVFPAARLPAACQPRSGHPVRFPPVSGVSPRSGHTIPMPNT